MKFPSEIAIFRPLITNCVAFLFVKQCFKKQFVSWKNLLFQRRKHRINTILTYKKQSSILFDENKHCRRFSEFKRDHKKFDDCTPCSGLPIQASTLENTNKFVLVWISLVALGGGLSEARSCYYQYYRMVNFTLFNRTTFND